VFNTVKSTTFKTLGCGAPQCKQVIVTHFCHRSR
jgi:hypothetical protein